MNVAEKLPPVSRVHVHLSMMYTSWCTVELREQIQTGAEKLVCWSSGNSVGESSGYVIHHFPNGWEE